MRAAGQPQGSKIFKRARGPYNLFDLDFSVPNGVSVGGSDAKNRHHRGRGRRVRISFLLNRAGREVTLIGRADQVEVLRTKGLRVEGYAGAHQVKIAAAERLDFKPDLVLLAVKTQDVAGALRENLPRLIDVPVVTLQNGVRGDDLAAELLPRDRIISAVVLLHANS